MCNDATLSARFSSLLGIPVEIAISGVPMPPDQFSERELRTVSSFLTSERRTAWLNGRTALKRLLRSHGESGDTAALAFPNARFSISHGPAWAVAVRSGSLVEGIGIDVEFARPPMLEEFRKLFLGAAELQWLDRMGRTATRDDELRLWTIKEAVFKADPANDASWLSDYVLEDPARSLGSASGGPFPSRTFRYASLKWGCARLSVAIFSGRSAHA